ncbi:dipeptide ABC transporter ATP-binding protein [Streptomyces sp. SID5770]|uniref:dipeptide ABC transporter ATP-binding protein n=1 Tax=Streptomyces sp. SID5770 TaxID=2690308 RepID=UPI001367D6F0|nr:ABC transporter ATP-binding protein [Streptomyces sp. SID5770]MZE55803.1 dipeptide ABC transporter ATP-binding protein [Streptomyces sp. SID5770]
MTLLEIEDLSVTFNGGPSSPAVRAVDSVDLTLEAGETLAVVGESGSGKTVTALSLLGLNPPEPVCGTTGSIRLDGTDLRALGPREWRAVRGRRVAMVFQDPGSALNPLLTLGIQITDAVRAHERLTREQARRRAVKALEQARMPEPERRLRQYPHELSGGMRQRAAIALAIAARPRLLIADEPTTALDVAVQAEIMAMLRSLCVDLGMGLILITHDLGVVAEQADRVAVMYAGRVVESGPAAQVLKRPRMPYTQALLAATPRLDAPARTRLVSIEGQPPRLRDRPSGCSFANRCPVAVDDCATTAPPLTLFDGGHAAACLFADAPVEPPAARTAPAARAVPAELSETVAEASAEPPIAEFDAVDLRYPVRSGALRRVTGHVHAVQGVSLKVEAGRTLALVGESGSGKTSLTKLLLRLERPSGGTVRYDGIDVTRPGPADLRRLQREVQVVFQNPYASLDPRLTVRQILEEPLRVHGLDAGEDTLTGLLRDVGLDSFALDRFPSAFSGGQRQRIAIARALALRPRLIVCDEAVSALDVSIQAQVLNLLADLQAEHGMAYLFITHDLAVVRSVAHRIAVMRHGRIVEEGAAEDIYAAPAHEYTRELLARAPGRNTPSAGGPAISPTAGDTRPSPTAPLSQNKERSPLWRR